MAIEMNRCYVTRQEAMPACICVNDDRSARTNMELPLTVAALASVFCLTIAANAGTPIQPQAKMGDPLPGLTPVQLERFFVGKEAFMHQFTEEEGLGPIYNKSSCGGCHTNPVGGPGSLTVTRFGNWDKGVFDPLDEYGGSLLQETFDDPNCQEVVPPPEVANTVRLRVTNGMMGYGLVEAIEDADLLYLQDNPPGGVVTQGRANMRPLIDNPNVLKVGRFGWKAQEAHVLGFSAGASRNEIGITNMFLPTENDPNGIFPPAISECDTVADPEDQPDKNGKFFFEKINDFQRFLTAPPQTPRSGMTGELVFMAIGCGHCHVPSYTTSNDSNLEDAIRNKVIKPYSDFLLHDMGQVDGIEQDGAYGSELRTPPLWGLRTRDPMMSNGSVGGGEFSDRITAAVAGHNTVNSQGVASALAFAALTQVEKNQLFAFLDSLGRVEFDSTGDNIIDTLEFLSFASCFTGSGQPYEPVGNPMDHACAVHDIDQDEDLDLDDFASFMMVYTGPRKDCNGNGILDLQEILTGALADANANAIPDSCEPTCTGDLNGGGSVEVTDLLGVINGWGECPASPAPCNADINLDEQVDVLDLLMVINFWGGCP